MKKFTVIFSVIFALAFFMSIDTQAQVCPGEGRTVGTRTSTETRTVRTTTRTRTVTTRPGRRVRARRSRVRVGRGFLTFLEILGSATTGGRGSGGGSCP